jgi:hypothetical protein
MNHFQNLLSTFNLRPCTLGDAVYKAAAKACLAALFVTSLIIRGLLQHPRKFSILRVGEHTHFSNLFTASSYGWMSDYYGYNMPVHARDRDAVGNASICRDAEYLHGYFNRLYLPMHARFGPMVLGALLAFLLPSGSERAAAGERVAGTAAAPGSRHAAAGLAAAGAAATAPVAVSAKAGGDSGTEVVDWAEAWWKRWRWWAHAAAFGIICLTVMPPQPADCVPSIAHSFVTMVLPNLFSGATAVLLYSALVPAGHAAHSAR